MPTLSMEATADGPDVPNPWSAPSAALINAADLDDPVDPSAGGSPFLASIPAERRKPVRDCAWHKEALDACLYQLGAKFLAGAATNSIGSFCSKHVKRNRKAAFQRLRRGSRTGNS
jgi:hypothetical protein